MQRRDFAQSITMPVVREPIHAPEFFPGEWLNAPPLSMAALDGKIVLVDFWNYTCSNCLRTLPYLLEWWHRYRAHGFMLVGIHTPEFAFAKRLENVTVAVQRLGIDYPVLLDNDQRNWSAWTNRFWPTKYLVDARGYIRYFCYGEGHYRHTEQEIQRLLREINPTVDLPDIMPALRPTDEQEAVCYRSTPELHLGYERGRLANRERYRPNQTVAYAAETTDSLDIVTLGGYWMNGPQSVTLTADVGTLAVRYRGKEVNLVAVPPDTGSGCIVIEQDGAPLPLSALGADARPNGGEVYVSVDQPRMYNLVKNPSYGTHHLRLRMTTPGISLYVLTFVTECISAESSEEAAA